LEIVHVVRQFSPLVGGLEDTVYHLCRNLRNVPDIGVRVVTLDRAFSDPSRSLPAYEEIEGIAVRRIGFAGSRRYPIAPRVLAMLDGADIVHVHAVDFFFDFLAMTKFIHRKPLVATTHGGFFHTSFAAGLKQIYFETVTRLSARAYRAITASSEGDAKTFARIAADRVKIVENAVDIDKWHDCGSKVPRKTLLYIGRWSANKRIHLLFDLLAALNAGEGGWRLIVIGVPYDYDEAQLVAEAERAGVRSSLRIVMAPSEAEIRTILGEASYIVSASAFEGFGISAIEGMSAGLVPVLSPIPSFSGFLAKLGFGVVLDVNDLARTAELVKQAHIDLAANNETQRNRAMAVAGDYDWPRITQKFVQIYRNVLKE